MTTYIDWIRGNVGDQKLLLVSTIAIIKDAKDRILWQQRGDMKLWGVPGGMLELNETLQENVVREAKEETGYDVKPERLVGIYSSPQFDVTYPNGDQVQNVAFAFECRLTGGRMKIDNEETLDLVWLPNCILPQNTTWVVQAVQDMCRNLPEPVFRSGTPGLRNSNEPYFKDLRRYIGQAPFIMAGAAAFIRNQNNQILLQRRTDDGNWGLPGGAVELGERIDQTIINEVREETGLEINPVRVIGVYSDDDFHLTYPHGDQIRVVSTFFECEITGGYLQADGVESADVRFFGADELPNLPVHHHRRVVDALQADDKIVVS